MGTPSARDWIPFNRPRATGREFEYIREAIDSGYLAGNGPFSQRCARRLEELTGAPRALLTTSGTAALELAALVIGIEPGDEVIMPSFTFVSTANAVALRGGVPVFVDIRPDTLNLDEAAVAGAVTPRTRAVIPVHYAGVGCEMDQLMEVASTHGLAVIEDAAQGILASCSGRPLGALGQLGCLSFHETKNVTSGEGGALLVNAPAWIERAEIALEKGTDRSRFFRGEVDRYRWIDLGSSFVLSDLNAAFLWAQLEEAEAMTARRLEIWERYHGAFAGLEESERVRRPIVPQHCRHNAHMYHLLLPDREARDGLIAELAERDVMAVFHYVPLHSSPAGRRHGRAAGPLPVTEDVSERLVRLPLWAGMSDGEVERVTAAVLEALQ
jgi:dTDP-4-amino-4,6-dideoxygalactose transaminase